ncbi:hypothetical protein GWI33_021946 [Rhynchophorus ferrugineus]|uniref:Uncharacterized protein n=1 Tax=Rhynchophorus ferrugineus TaxID=354439 RepID=A0A834MLH4_RHYFE|nr:hypothetical protein GWI33_021946 [Rhynchophorus ferrugineus]
MVVASCPGPQDVASRMENRFLKIYAGSRPNSTEHISDTLIRTFFSVVDARGPRRFKPLSKWDSKTVNLYRVGTYGHLFVPPDFDPELPFFREPPPSDDTFSYLN